MDFVNRLFAYVFGGFQCNSSTPAYFEIYGLCIPSKAEDIISKVKLLHYLKTQAVTVLLCL